MFKQFVRNVAISAISTILYIYFLVPMLGLSSHQPIWETFFVMLGAAHIADAITAWWTRPLSHDYTPEEIAEMEAADAAREADRIRLVRLNNAEHCLALHRLDVTAPIERAVLAQRVHLVAQEFGENEIDTIEAAVRKLDKMRFQEGEEALAALHADLTAKPQIESLLGKSPRFGDTFRLDHDQDVIQRMLDWCGQRKIPLTIKGDYDDHGTRKATLIRFENTTDAEAFGYHWLEDFGLACQRGDA